MRYLFLLLSLLSFCVFSQAQPILELADTISGFSSPVKITNAGDGSNRLFIVERGARIKVYDQNTETTQAADYLNLTDRVRSGGERGLLGLAFHPDFTTTRHLYVNYTSNGTNGTPNNATVISRFTAATTGATTVDTATELVILTINQPFSNHNGGDLAFGPDGFLYIPTGDGGGSGDNNDNGQDPQSLLGKLLRIDVDNPAGGKEYSVPMDNPFLGDATVRDEIWALGLRNPFRFSFDRQTGDIWIGDVGQNRREEVDFQPVTSNGGENYGWDCREGTLVYDINNNDPDSPSPLCAGGSSYIDPIFEYDHGSMGGVSVTGGYVYRGEIEDLQGYYICADFASDRFFLLSPDEGSGRTLYRQTNVGINSVSSFGEDETGELYVVSLGGSFSRIVTAQFLPVDFTRWTVTPRDKKVDLNWATSKETGARDFAVERSRDGRQFSTVGTVRAAGNSNQLTPYTFTDEAPLSGRSFYRLRQRDLDGAEELLPVRSVFIGQTRVNEPVLSPNPTTRDLSLVIPELREAGTVSLTVFAADGRTVYQKIRLDGPGHKNYNYVLPELPGGLYRVVIGYDGATFSRNLVVR